MEEIRKNLNELHIQYDKFARNIIIILSVLFISQMGLGIWNLNLSQENNNRINEIKSSRKSSILTSCTEQNLRNDNTVYNLNKLLNKAKITSKAQLQQTKFFTIVLIDSLAPKQDCAARLKKFTKP
jgi:hypothetical protein